MKISRFAFAATGASFLLSLAPVAQAQPTLAEWDLNTDGVPDSTGFNTTTGLGTITVTISGVGARKSYLFVDHELSSASNTFFNEVGEPKAGALPAGLSYEIDEPGWQPAPNGPGDIFDNYSALTLDNGTFKVGAATLPTPNDVAMAFGWDFSLLAGETAYINYVVADSLQAVGTRYYLSQTDPDSNETIYFATDLVIRGGGGPQPIPEASTILGAGGLALLLGGSYLRRRQRGAASSV